MNAPSTVEAEPEVVAQPPVLVLPGHLFFVDRIELPEELDRAELSEFAELSLEGIAPFPIEQLYWGFIQSETAGALLLYAAFKDRIHKLGFTELESYTWVLPDFATLNGASFAEKTVVQIKTADTTTLLHFEPGETLPSRIDSVFGSSTHDRIGTEASPLLLQIESIALSEQGLPTFRFQASDAATEAPTTWQELRPAEDTLWQADVRNAEFKTAERNNRRMTKWVTRATGYATLLLLLFLLLEGVLYLGNFWVGRLDTKIAQQAPEVLKIEDKQSLMLKLDQVAQNELRPIAILDALNTTRPDGIYFTDAIVEGQNLIRIEGIANTINELNTYVDSLKASGNFELQDQETNFRGGKTSFRVSLNYTHTASTEQVAAQEDPAV